MDMTKNGLILIIH